VQGLDPCQLPLQQQEQVALPPASTTHPIKHMQQSAEPLTMG
jgi:hypothetical protein